jgi:ribosomal protein S20
VNETIKANITGIDQREMVPATSAMLSSWPKRVKSGVVKKNTGRRMSAVKNNTIHDL